MDTATLRQNAIKVLSDVDKVRSLPQEETLQKERLWAQIVDEMKAFPKAKPGLRVVYASSLQRASKTAELAAVTANNLPEIVLTEAIREIQIGKELSDDLVKAAEEILMDAGDRNEAVARLRLLFAHHSLAAPVEDTPDNRKRLTDPQSAFEGGDSIYAYTLRILKGYMGVLMHSLEGETRTVEEIVSSLPNPTFAFIDHMFTVQNLLQESPRTHTSFFNPEAPYPPLTALCESLAGRRVVFARHGDTSFSKQKLWTGGNVDTKLIDEGIDAAVETGIILKLYNKTHPNHVKIVQVYGHSAAAAIAESAICAACPNVKNLSNGQYKVAEPHILDFAETGELTITPVSRHSLMKELMDNSMESLLEETTI